MDCALTLPFVNFVETVFTSKIVSFELIHVGLDIFGFFNVLGVTMILRVEAMHTTLLLSLFDGSEFVFCCVIFYVNWNIVVAALMLSGRFLLDFMLNGILEI